MNETIFHASDPAATGRLGRLLAETLPNGGVVALIGTLGSGKTRLVQAVAESAGVDADAVSSPTFVLLHEYDGDRLIYHFDVYRLSDAEEFRRLGPDDYFESDGVTFVEWADKFPEVLPAERLEIRIEIDGETGRRFRFTASGEQYRDCMESIESASRPPDGPGAPLGKSVF